MLTASRTLAPGGAEGLTYRSAAVGEAVLVVHGRRCRYCGHTATDVDHIIARWRGGSDEVTNLTASCDPCNTRKGRSALSGEVEAAILAEAQEAAPFILELASRIRSARRRARLVRRGDRVGLIYPCTNFTLRITRSSRDAFMEWCSAERMSYREGFRRMMAAVRKGAI